MNWIAVARAASLLALLIAGLTGVFVVIAAVGGSPMAGAFFVTSIAAGLFGGVVWLIVWNQPMRSGLREAVAWAVLLWAMSPVFIAIPFVAVLTPAGFAEAYFHAVSALTTTGYPPNGYILGSDLLKAWWLVVQWVGGIWTLLTCIIVLAALNVTGVGVQRTSLLTIDADAVFARLTVVGPTVITAYTLATAAAWLATFAGGATLGQSFAIAVAGVSTGGLVFFGDQPASLLGSDGVPMAALVGASLALVFGALSLAAPYRSLSAERNRWFDGEVIMFAVLCVIVALAAWPIDAPDSLRDVVSGGFEALALVSTAGWDAGQGGVRSLPVPMVLVVIILGAGAISTAGGVKLRRVLLMGRQLGGELQRLAHPSSVSDSERAMVRPGGDVAVSVGVYFFAFGVTATALMLAFAASGLSFQSAAAAAVTSLVNAGPTFEPAARDPSANLDTMARQLIACGGMVVGRLEVVAAFVIVAPAFWRR